MYFTLVVFNECEWKSYSAKREFIAILLLSVSITMFFSSSFFNSLLENFKCFCWMLYDKRFNMHIKLRNETNKNARRSIQIYVDTATPLDRSWYSLVDFVGFWLDSNFHLLFIMIILVVHNRFSDKQEIKRVEIKKQNKKTVGRSS